MITTDPIARIIDDAAAQGFELRRASELQPEATAGLLSGEERNGETAMASRDQWKDACERMANKADRDRASAAEVLFDVLGEQDYTSEQQSIAHEIVDLRAQLRDAKRRLRKSGK